MKSNDLENFGRMLSRLKSFLAGVIQAFEFTFEQCWKALQKVAAKSGGQVGNVALSGAVRKVA